MAETLLTITEVAKQYKITARQLRWWDAGLGILVPQRRGAVRMYGRQELDRLHQVLQMLENGMGHQEIRGYLRARDFVVDRKSVPTTREFEDKFAKAKIGSVVRQRVLDRSEKSYNSAYRRLTRAAAKHGKKVKVGYSEDQTHVEAKVIGSGLALKGRQRAS